MSAELAAAEDRLLGLEAEATLLKGRIRTAADNGNLDAVTEHYRRIDTLRLDLLAARHTVVRLTRKEHRHHGEATALNVCEHHLAIELARLGIQPDPAMQRIFG
jgi:hypothetical protein